MFCRQCEQTQNGVACTTQGICGKDADTSAMQDAAIHMVKAISIWCVSARKAGVSPDKLHDANIWTLRTTFSTLTNVNFSEKSVAAFISEGLDILNSLKFIVPPDAAPKEEVAHPPISTSDDLDMYEAFGRSVGVLKRKDRMGDDDAFSLNEIGLYGLKGVCAYACHASELLDNKIPEDIIAPIHEIWNKLASDEPDMEGLLANALRVGEVNAATLALLDESHAKSLGIPEPTEVKETAVKGKAILVSGHDMKDLQVLLEQTEGTGVNVYTHG
jgi:hydroxylamine reductase